ncbi:MAG TPA: DUF1698 domain-containing protein [bacterium]|nr:DUF1698 domain-containing protein [bacterium]
MKLRDRLMLWASHVPAPLKRLIPLSWKRRVKFGLGYDRMLARPKPRTLPHGQYPPEVAAIHWFHQIDLGGGIVTPGIDDSAAKLRLLGMPESLAGRTVLDIGAWDGFFSFEAERRGARRVLATDSVAWFGRTWTSKAGFELARRVLHSKVEDRDIDVMDLSPEIVGTFDLVLFLGVFYHLKYPYRALELVHALTAGMLILETEAHFTDEGEPSLLFLPGHKDDPTNWWVPNREALQRMLRSVGFSRVECYAPGTLRQGKFGRLTFHAWK